eukprot:Clim_evm23s251 gene=Clim_evmTU23s251
MSSLAIATIQRYPDGLALVSSGNQDHIPPDLRRVLKLLSRRIGQLMHRTSDRGCIVLTADGKADGKHPAFYYQIRGQISIIVFLFPGGNSLAPATGWTLCAEGIKAFYSHVNSSAVASVQRPHSFMSIEPTMRAIVEQFLFQQTLPQVAMALNTSGNETYAQPPPVMSLYECLGNDCPVEYIPEQVRQALYENSLMPSKTAQNTNGSSGYGPRDYQDMTSVPLHNDLSQASSPVRIPHDSRSGRTVLGGMGVGLNRFATDGSESLASMVMNGKSLRTDQGNWDNGRILSVLLMILVVAESLAQALNRRIEAVPIFELDVTHPHKVPGEKAFVAYHASFGATALLLAYALVRNVFWRMVPAILLLFMLTTRLMCVYYYDYYWEWHTETLQAIAVLWILAREYSAGTFSSSSGQMSGQGRHRD